MRSQKDSKDINVQMGPSDIDLSDTFGPRLDPGGTGPEDFLLTEFHLEDAFTSVGRALYIDSVLEEFYKRGPLGSSNEMTVREASALLRQEGMLYYTDSQTGEDLRESPSKQVLFSLYKACIRRNEALAHAIGTFVKLGQAERLNTMLKQLPELRGRFHPMTGEPLEGISPEELATNTLRGSAENIEWAIGQIGKLDQ